MTMTLLQCRMARAALRWGVRDLGEHARVSFTTISRFENGGGTQTSTLDKIRTALEEAGVTLISDDGEGPGVRVKDGREVGND